MRVYPPVPAARYRGHCGNEGVFHGTAQPVIASV